ncbi:MAG TPA: Spy/CpxP family protein refolding chaperone [Gemmatimonadaceae bacterium]|nr:Spy/CpxP family protein refolding chaperone [Gemmatimonadaceae bacterium]
MARIRMAALAAALMIGASSTVLAQEQPRPEQGQEQRKGPRHGRMKAGHARMGKALFRGITLTDAQKSRLEQIRASYRTRFESLRSEMRPGVQAMRDARQKNDTAAFRAARTRLQEHREQMRALADQRRGEVRGVLTAEQQVTFDKNVAEIRDRAAKRAEHRRQHGGKRGMRRGVPRGQNRGA